MEALRVHPIQRRYVDDVRDSLAEADTYEPLPWCRGIYAGHEPVGFAMLADQDPSCRWPYYLWRFLIDERYQGRGYGRAALDLVVAYVRARPQANALVTSVASYGENEGSPLGFYVAYGFVPTGDLSGSEVVIRYDLVR